MLNGVDGKYITRANCKAYSVIHNGIPRVFYKTIQRIVGTDDLSSSELTINYGNLSENLLRSEKIKKINKDVSCSFLLNVMAR